MHQCEVIQQGLLPIYVYHKTPWLPFKKQFEQFGFACTLKQLPSVLRRVERMPESELRERERLALQFSSTHFNYDRTLDQIAQFMLGRPNDLQCEPLPSFAVRTAASPC